MCSLGSHVCFLKMLQKAWDGPHVSGLSTGNSVRPVCPCFNGLGSLLCLESLPVLVSCSTGLCENLSFSSASGRSVSGFSISNLAPSPAQLSLPPPPPPRPARQPGGVQSRRALSRARRAPGTCGQSPAGTGGRGRGWPQPSASPFAPRPGRGGGPPGLGAGVSGALTSKRAAGAGSARRGRGREPGAASLGGSYLRAGPSGGRASCRRGCRLQTDRVGEWERGPKPSPRK